MTEDELMAQEDRCRKSLRTLGRALVMRLAVTVLLMIVALAGPREGWVLGLLALVLLINLGGAFPLAAEWKKQRSQLRHILSQYE